MTEAQQRLDISPSLRAFLRTVSEYYNRRPMPDEVLEVYQKALKGHQIPALEQAFQRWIVENPGDRPPRAAELLGLVRVAAPEATRVRAPEVTMTPLEKDENTLRAAFGYLVIGIEPSRVGLAVGSAGMDIVRAVYAEWASTPGAVGTVLPGNLKPWMERVVARWRALINGQGSM